MNFACFVALVLLVWFKTEAFVEYFSFIKPLAKLFKLDQFKDIKDNGGELSYPEFLAEYYNSFFTRLISCPICMSVWAGLFLSPLTGLAYLGFNIIFGLFIYLIIAKLL